MSVTGRECSEDDITEEFYERVKRLRDFSCEWKRLRDLLHLWDVYYMQKDKLLRNGPYGGSSAVNSRKTNRIASKNNEGRQLSGRTDVVNRCRDCFVLTHHQSLVNTDLPCNGELTSHAHKIPSDWRHISICLHYNWIYMNDLVTLTLLSQYMGVYTCSSVN
jgi:hypothetical protein